MLSISKHALDYLTGKGVFHPLPRRGRRGKLYPLHEVQAYARYAGIPLQDATRKPAAPASHPLITPPAALVSVADAATMLHLAPRTVRDLITRGHLPARRIYPTGRKYLLPAAAVQAYSRAQRGETDALALANVQALNARMAHPRPRRRPLS